MSSLSDALDKLLGGGGGAKEPAAAAADPVPIAAPRPSKPLNGAVHAQSPDGDGAAEQALGRAAPPDDPFAAVFGAAAPSAHKSAGDGATTPPRGGGDDSDPDDRVAGEHSARRAGDNTVANDRPESPASSTYSKKSSSPQPFGNGHTNHKSHVTFELDKPQDEPAGAKSQQSSLSQSSMHGELPQSPIDELLQRQGIDDIDNNSRPPTGDSRGNKPIYRKGSSKPLLRRKPETHAVVQHYWVTNSDGPQAANFQSWLVTKREAQRAKLQQLAEEKRAEQEKLKTQAERIDMASKAFAAWRSSKADEIKERRAKEAEEKRLAETVDEDKKKDKRDTAATVFKSWAEQKRDARRMTVEKQRSKQEREEEMKRHKEEEKRSLAETCFQEWKRQKDAELEEMRQKLRITEERKKTVYKHSDGDVDDKRKAAQKAYEAWLQMKERERLESMYRRSRGGGGGGVAPAQSLPSLQHAGRVDVPWLPPSPLAAHADHRRRHGSSGHGAKPPVARPQTTYASHYRRHRL